MHFQEGAVKPKNFLSRICCKGCLMLKKKIWMGSSMWERFEMEPVFPTEQEEDVVVKHVRLAGEIIIQEKGGDQADVSG
ncbi:hypothetical protein Leryth_024771 [Lithospermum erythrorhizon]|nr:hypothetical protein Leryth_024771 [Lithospermum erythrorhizon]